MKKNQSHGEKIFMVIPIGNGSDLKNTIIRKEWKMREKNHKEWEVGRKKQKSH